MINFIKRNWQILILGAGVALLVWIVLAVAMLLNDAADNATPVATPSGTTIPRMWSAVTFPPITGTRQTNALTAEREAPTEPFEVWIEKSGLYVGQIMISREPYYLEEYAEYIEFARLFPDIDTLTAEVEAIAKTLAGECYVDQYIDRAKVAQVIVSRVSDPKFEGDSVIAVLTASSVNEKGQVVYQFNGYWRQSREIDPTDYAIAWDILLTWYEGGKQPLTSYRYFTGDNGTKQNIFK